MARLSGQTKLSTNVDVLANAPFDARMWTQSYSGLTDGTIPQPYLGMLVSVYADSDPNKNGLYFCTDIGGIGLTTTENTKWVPVGSNVGGITAATYVASAGTINFSGTSSGSTFQSTGILEYVNNLSVSNNSISGYTNISGNTVVYGGIIDAVTGGYLSGSTLHLTGTGFLTSGVTIPGFGSLTSNPFTGGTSSAGIEGTTALTATLVVSGETSGTTIDLKNVLTFTNQATTKRDVGGIPEGSLIFQSGKTIHQILQEIFYPVEYPTISPISTSLSRNTGGPGFSSPNLQIVGSTGVVTLTAGYTSGTSIVTGNASTQRKTGPVLQYLFSGSGIPTPIINVTSNISDGATVTTDPYTAQTGYNTWGAVISYDVGQQPVDDSLQPFNSSQTTQFTQSGTVTTSPVTIEGVYPIFANSTTLTTETQQILYSNLVKVACQTGVNPPTSLGGIVIYFVQGDDNDIAIYFKIPTYMVNNLGNPTVYVYNFNSQVYSNVTYGWIITDTTMLINGSTVNYKLYTWNKATYGKFGDRYIRLCF